jgi:hypothetical protein
MSRNIACAGLIAGGITAGLCAIGAAGIALAPRGSGSILGDFLQIEIAALPRTVGEGQLFAVCVGLTAAATAIAALVAWLAADFPHWVGSDRRGSAHGRPAGLLRI